MYLCNNNYILGNRSGLKPLTDRSFLIRINFYEGSKLILLLPLLIINDGEVSRRKTGAF